MAFNKSKLVSIQKQKLSRKVNRNQVLGSRYTHTEIMNDGDIKRLTFKRYTQYKTTYNQGMRGEVPPEREHRPDLIANKLYNNPRMYWVITMFNRWISLNPFRLKVGSVIVLPFPDLIQKWIAKKVL